MSGPDVLVVGAGVAGLFCASFLREQGRSVTVVDRGTVGGPAAASAGNTGFVAHGGVPLAGPGAIGRGLRATVRPNGHLAVPFLSTGDTRRWLRDFRSACTPARSAGTATLLAALKNRSIEILGDTGGVTRSGLVIAYRTRPAFDAAAAAVPAAVARGIAARVLEEAELRAMEPGVDFAISGAVYQDGGMFVEVPAFLTALAARLVTAGVDIREHTDVTGFDTDAGTVTGVRTTGGTLRPGETVIATGAWSATMGRLLCVAVPVQPVRGYAVTVATPAGAPSRPVLLGERTVAVRPLGDRLRIAGGLTLSADPGVSRRQVAALVGAVHAYLPGLRIPESREVWTGFRPCTPDSLPLLGRHPAYRNVSFACGHGHIGMGLAPAAGRMVAQLIAGEPTDLDPEPFRPDRFARRT